jgi:hypothetical protein
VIGDAPQEPPDLSGLFGAIAQLPRPALERLVKRLVDRLDDMDGDADLEDAEGCHHSVDAKGRWIGEEPCAGAWWEDDEDGDQDCCLAGDDRVCAGPVIVADVLGFSSRLSLYQAGMAEDIETQSWATFGAQSKAQADARPATAA